MRRSFLVSSALLAVGLWFPSGQAFAQIAGAGVGADPFSFYYGYYLPHQAAIAATPTPLDTINQVQSLRTRAAMTDRAALYDPISPYGDEDDEEGLGRRGGERKARSAMSSGPGANSNHRGTGPPNYYNRAQAYFPTLRTGRGPNMNVSVHRSSRGGGMGGGMGMGGMGGGGMGMPGPR